MVQNHELGGYYLAACHDVQYNLLCTPRAGISVLEQLPQQFFDVLTNLMDVHYVLWFGNLINNIKLWVAQLLTGS